MSDTRVSSPEEIREAADRIHQEWETRLHHADHADWVLMVEAARAYADLLEKGRHLTVTADHKLEPALSLWPGRYLVVSVEPPDLKLCEHGRRRIGAHYACPVVVPVEDDA